MSATAMHAKQRQRGNWICLYHVSSKPTEIDRKSFFEPPVIENSVAKAFLALVVTNLASTTHVHV
jgi:hypothetical protein